MDRGFGFGPHGRGAGRGQGGNDGVPYGVPPAGAPFGLGIVEPRQAGRGGALRPNPLHLDNADADPPIVGAAADPLAPLAPQRAQPAPARELDFERDVIEDDYAEEEPVQGAAQAAVPDIQALLRELAALRAAVEARPGGAPAVAYGVAPAAPRRCSSRSPRVSPESSVSQRDADPPEGRSEIRRQDFV
ncbi:Neuron navigator 1 [Frankliniella fusca]|uniref:Neuron navigator 1 n=1 Tax=Frankliniella fusca TaxID=407009 RepID=A0AAE1HAF6_9NEOP|nr:Neuron navigator 1 [Frankliniella fusca]